MQPSFMRSLCLLGLLIHAFSAAPADIRAEPSPFVIGVILPLTGMYESLGGGVKDGINFAYNELSPEEQAKVRLIFEDDGLQAARSVAAFHKLRKLNKAEAFIAVSSGIGHALAPLAETERTPLLAVGASDYKIAQGRRFSFLQWVMPETEAVALAGETRKRGYQRIALITAEQQGWITLRSELIKQFAKEGLKEKIVIDERRAPDETSFHTFAARVRSKDAQVVVMLIMPEPMVALVKQLRQSGSQADLVGPEMFDDNAVIDAVGELLQGQWYVNADSALPEFENKYKSAMGKLPGFGVANSYDSFNLLYEAGVRRGLRSEGIADYLHTLRDYRGAAGLYSATGDNRFTLPAAVKRIVKGRYEKLSSVAP